MTDPYNSSSAYSPTPPPPQVPTMSLNDAMVTTALELPGYRIRRNLGMVRGITVRYDATDVMAGLTEVLCYGTAVVVEPQDV